MASEAGDDFRTSVAGAGISNALYLSLLTLMILLCGITECNGYGSPDDMQHLTDAKALGEVPVAEMISLSKKHNHGLDLAALTAEFKGQGLVELFLQYDVCHTCSLLHMASLDGKENATLKVATQFPLQLVVSRTINKTYSEPICREHYHFGERGSYLLVIDGLENSTCTLYQRQPPINSFMPIYVSIVIFFALAVAWTISKYVIRYIVRRLANSNSEEQLVNSDLGAPTNVGLEDSPDSELIIPRKPRLRSLDTFRGLSLVIMIFVNYKGGEYWFFHHSTWDGLTVADLVFPWFTFIMGTSIALAFKGQLNKGKSRLDLAKKTLKRTLILFAIGIVLSNRGDKGLVDPKLVRIPGVLQRLAATYFVVALMEVFFAMPDDRYAERWWAVVRDLLPFWPEWIATLAFVALHLGLTFLLSIPDCPRGYLGPGGLADNGSYANCTGGAAAVIDRAIFGHNHIYKHPSCINWYQCSVPHDPEGILGTLTSILICFLGLHAGKILIFFQSWKERVLRWGLWCVITGIVAGALCNFQQYGGVIPLNKNLWSLSFVLALASMAYLLLIVLYIAIDVVGFWNGAPFFYPGMNSIVIYVCHELFHNAFPVQFKVDKTHAALLAMNLYGAALWVIVSIILHYKGVFIAI